MNCNFSEQTSRALVERCPNLRTRPKGTLFVTISPNPKANVSKKYIGKDRKKQARYGTLTQLEQYDYCMRIFKQNYSKQLFGCEYVGTWELNKQGNLHLHFIICSSDVTNDYQLKVFQRDVYNDELTQQNLHNGKGLDVMNNIVFLNKSIDEICSYLDKDHDDKLPIMRKTVMKNYCSNIGDELEPIGTIIEESAPQVLRKKDIIVKKTINYTVDIDDLN